MTANAYDAVGVIKGRFQIYEPHEGHRHTFETALGQHRDVLVILGTRYDDTIHDPYPFEIRKMMLESLYPGRLTIIPDESSPLSYEHRSVELDALIESAFPGRPAVIYGARDSIVHTYRGKFPVVEVPTVYAGSATELRKNIPILDSKDFRMGWGAAVNNRKRLYHPAVDVAILRRNSEQVLLISKKDDDGKLRFPGVFFDPDIDDSYETAGNRCVQKETPGLQVGIPKLLQSKKLDDDWRYRQTNDGVISVLMTAGCSGGEATPGEPGIARVVWVQFWWNEVPDFIAPVHRPLAEIISRKWYW